MKFFKKLTVLLLVCAIIISSFGTIQAQAAEEDYFPEVEHDMTPYSELSHEAPDMEDCIKLTDELTELLLEESIDAEAVADIITALDDMCYDFAYTNRIVYNDMCLDAADTATAEKYALLEANFYEVDTILIEEGKKAFASAAGEQIKSLLDEGLVEYIEGEEPLTETQKALLNEINELQGEYNLLCNLQYTAEYEGVQYSSDDFYTMYIYGMIDLETYYDYTGRIGKQYNDSLADVYFRMVDARQKLAKEYGYENFYEYVAVEGFSRDNTIKQIRNFATGVRKYIAPLYNVMQIINAYEPNYVGTSELYSSEAYELEEMIDYVGEFVEGISSEMDESFDYMRELGLYNLINDGNRVPTTYTVAVAPNKPYIQNGFSNSFGSLLGTLVHEYGHFNEMYYFNIDELGMNFDLAEIHSTGLEMLSLDCYDELFGVEVTSNLATAQVTNFLYLMVYGCLLDELEQHIYIDGVEGMDEINEYYMTLLREYGMVDDTDLRTAAYGWADVSHIFLSPCYYISYALSSAVSLELYVLSLKDYDAAVTSYLKICGSGSNPEKGFRDTVIDAGLTNPLKQSNLSKFADEICTALNVDARLDALLAPPEEENVSFDYKIYQIKKGDTLGKIAAEHKISLDDILSLNAIEDPGKIYAGTLLILPAEAVMQTAEYTIQAGDTLYEIAKAFDASIDSIAYQCGIEDYSLIYAGDILKFEY